MARRSNYNPRRASVPDQGSLLQLSGVAHPRAAARLVDSLRAAERREQWRAPYLQLASVHERIIAENKAKAIRLAGARGEGVS